MPDKTKFCESEMSSNRATKEGIKLTNCFEELPFIKIKRVVVIIWVHTLLKTAVKFYSNLTAVFVQN